MNSAHNAMGTLLHSKWCSPTQCQSYAKKNPFTFKTMRKCSCSSCPVPKTVSKQKLEIQLLVSHLLSFLIFDLFCTYWAVLGLFASLLAWMDPFILWPHSLTELFSEKALQLTAPFSFFPLFFWVKASSCALKFWQCCSAHGSQRESRFRCRDHDVCQQSRANLKVGSASHF